MNETLRTAEAPICCRTRTGKKLHKAFAGSSVTFCGHWMKFNAHHTKIEREVAVNRGYALCEKCFGAEEQKAVADPRTPTQFCPDCKGKGTIVYADRYEVTCDCAGQR